MSQTLIVLSSDDVTIQLPFGLNLIAVISALWSFIPHNYQPDILQILAVWSSEPVATISLYENLENSRQNTAFLWPERMESIQPDSVSQILQVRSQLAVAKFQPCLLNIQLVMGCLWALVFLFSPQPSRLPIVYLLAIPEVSCNSTFQCLLDLLPVADEQVFFLLDYLTNVLRSGGLERIKAIQVQLLLFCVLAVPKDNVDAGRKISKLDSLEGLHLNSVYVIGIIQQVDRYEYKHNFYSMQRSHIVSEDQMYVQFNDQGTTKLMPAKDIIPGYSYRRVHYTHESEWRDNRSANEVFLDPEWQVDKSQLSKLDPRNSNVVLKRLYDLYRQSPKNQKPQFFPTTNFNINRVKDHMNLPPFVTEIGILPIEHYKSLFLTQDFVNHGLYEIIINQNGRFETDVVDDWVPVYEDSLEPIWGMDLEHAWQIILLKFWAKKNRSYYKIKEIPPFRFIQFFTNSNWKYFNLQKQGFYFLDYYTGKIPFGKFVLKTKNTDEVYRSGLIPNSAGYQLLDLREVTGKSKPEDKKFNLQVRSTLINRWSGSMSVLDKEINQKYELSKHKMALQRDFMMNHNDFLNLFSSAFIASRREKHNYFSDYYLLSIPANIKNAIYLKFDVKQQGWFDFCIKQFDDNRVQYTTTKSQVRNQAENRNLGIAEDGKRYLKLKFILVRDNSTGRSSTRIVDNDYNPPLYDVYQIEYLHGYNRGDARFENIVPGTYYLRIKPEKYGQGETKYVVNYSSNSRISMEEVSLSKQQRSAILRQAMSSMIGELTSYSLDVNHKYEQIVFANLFEEVGYGFVGVRMKRNCPYRVLIQVDPKLVRESGYKLKNQFKLMEQPFSVIVSKGESTSIVMNKINPSATWPPKGIDIFKEQ